MKKKIISAAMAVVLMFAVFAMTASAVNTAYVQVYYFGGETAGASYEVYLRENTTLHFYTMEGSAWGIQTPQVKLQCTVGYSDGTFDQEFLNPNSDSGSVDVFYDTSKTVTYVDMELHIYSGTTYVGTASDTYNP